MIAHLRTFQTIGFWWTCASLFAQIPETDLFVFQLHRDDTARWHIHSPRLLSAWNQGGYTNQPEWIDNGRLLVSVLKIGDTQNEIYRLDLELEQITRCTDTPESEFSPTVTPDGKSFSVVRQVHGDTMDQQLYRFSLDLSTPGIPILPGVQNVGYHCWLDDTDLALFLVDDPPKLAFVTKDDRTPRIYSSQIGRSLKRTPDGALAYVHKYDDSYWYLKTMETATRRSEILVETPGGREDFTIGPTGCYFMGSGSKLYVYDPERPGLKWRLVYDLGVFGISNITRLAINSENQIAVVDQKM